MIDFNNFINQFPYSDFHEMNLDWILKAIKQLVAEINGFEAANSVSYEGVWDITKQYTAWSIVLDTESGYLKICKKPVPSGIAIDNKDYWMLASPFKIDTEFNVDSYNAIANKIVSNKFNSVDSDIADLKDTDNQLSLGISGNRQLIDTNAAAIEAESVARETSDAALNGRINNIVALEPGSTTGDAELQDIRVAENGVEYLTAGSSIRAQISDLKKEDNDILSVISTITSVNKLDSNFAIGSIASALNNKVFYLGNNKTLADYSSPALVVFCRTTNTLTGLTAQWLKDDGTTESGYITFNTVYNTSTISNKDHIVGIKFITYSVGASLVISKLGIKFNNNTSTDDEDLYVVHYSSTRLDNLESRVANTELYSFDDPDEIELTDGDGVLQTSGGYNTSSESFKHGTGSVVPGNHYKISGRTFGATYPVYLWLDSSDNILSYGTAGSEKDYTEIGIAPDNASKIVINYSSAHQSAKAILGTLANSQDYIDSKLNDLTKSYWKDKKIVWFGTSIPAGVVNDGEGAATGSYPSLIADMLGATVYNESIGGSAVRAGDEHAVTPDDPMGYGGMSAPGLMLSLSLSSSEKQAIFDNWESKWVDIITYNQELINPTNPTYQNMYKRASWDILLSKYLTGGSVGPCDLYVFDHGYNDGVKTYGWDDLSDIPESSTDRKYFIGAMNFLIQKILADNPNAQICFIGHWSDDKGSGVNSTKLVADAQEKIADIWKYPLVKTWKKIGWSSNVITSGGATKPVYQFWCLDGVHPASDTTGKALRHYAEVLYPYIRDIR